MENSYKIKVNKTFELSLSKEKLEPFDVVEENNSIYHVLYNNKAFKAKVVEKNFFKKEYTIFINSNTYHVKLNNGLDLLFDKMGFSKNTGKQNNKIEAPIPGVVIDLIVREGDTIKEGEPLLILEAMKMENIISCPKDATVKKIHVEKGNAVEKGKLLIELD